MKKTYKKFLASFVILCMLGVFVSISAWATGTTVQVSNATELSNALADNNVGRIEITADFTVDTALTHSGSRSKTIVGDAHTLTLGTGINSMFQFSSTTVSFENIILDGNTNGRLIDAQGTTLSISGSTLKRGSTQSFEKKIENGVNNQAYQGGAIYANSSTINLISTTFSDNTTKTNTPFAENGGDPAPSPNGGAIYVGGQSRLNINGGKFLNNVAGSVVGGVGANGEGGAIKVDGGSVLRINTDSTTAADTTVFEGNHLSHYTGGGNQGGAIEITGGSAYIYGTTFTIGKTFDTGGAIKFEGVNSAEIKNSVFTIPPSLGYVGTAGGAITSERTNLTMDSVQLNAGDGSRVREAGGLIQVVGTGTFNLTNSTLNGAGAWWNAGKYTANMGGAISFYTGSSVTATIENTTISNFMADRSGAAIAVSNKIGDSGSVNLTLRNTTISNNATYTWDNNGYGGGLFVGAGNTVTIEGGKIENPTASNNAGAIYNEGSVTISGGAQIINNKAYQMVGGIYNNGYLKIDNARLANNTRGDYSTGNGHQLSASEMGGENIYADKDVVITPNASFDARDIRVLHGQSAIVLTGALTSQINVSISEAPTPTPATSGLATAYNETENRHIGYIVAKGDGTYQLTEADAKYLHYVSKDTSQAISAYAEETVGKWDYVLDPVAYNVVLGQRAKMIYHDNRANFANAKFADGSQTKEQIYTIYSSVTPWTQPAQMTRITDEPSKTGYFFVDWYENQHTEAEIAADYTDPRQSLARFNFSDTKFTDSATRITSIVNPHILNAYAGYVKLANITHQFYKEAAVTIALPNEIEGRTTGKDFQSAYAVGVNPNTAVDTTDFADTVNDGVWSFSRWDPTSLTVDEETEIFKGYWNFTRNTYIVTHEFKVADGITLTLPTEIMNRLPANQTGKVDNETVAPGSVTNTSYYDSANDGDWTFASWDKQSDVIQRANVHFVGTWNFVKRKYKATHEFVKAESVANGITLPQEIKNRTPADILDKSDGDTVVPGSFVRDEYIDTINDGKWNFVSWDKDSATITKANVHFTGKWNFTPNTYTVSHKFTVDNGITLPLPTAISDRITADTKFTGLRAGAVVSPNTAISTTSYYDALNDGTWAFVAWDKNSYTVQNADGEFIGTWTFTKNTYVVEHTFVKADDVPAEIELPVEITNRLPINQTDKVDGEIVYPSNFNKATVSDASEGTEWTFVGWDKEDDVIDKANVKFIGKWQYIKHLYKAHYRFRVENATSSDALPQEVMQKLPIDEENLPNGTEIEVLDYTLADAVEDIQDMEDADGNVVSRKGKWIFLYWENNVQTVQNADLEFVGVWKFVPDDIVNPVDPDVPDEDTIHTPSDATPSDADKNQDNNIPRKNNSSGSSGSSNVIKKVPEVPSVPTSEVRIEQPIVRPETQLSGLPKTSDTVGSLLGFAILASSSLGIFILLKKRREN